MLNDDNIQVEKLDSKSAVAKYHPDIAICSWMPYETDFTADFRREKNLKEYILIGETSGSCGDYWKTWGEHFYPKRFDFRKPPYEKEGFEHVDLTNISQYQICRTDDLGPEQPNSLTVSFRRK